MLVVAWNYMMISSCSRSLHILCPLFLGDFIVEVLIRFLCLKTEQQKYKKIKHYWTTNASFSVVRSTNKQLRRPTMYYENLPIQFYSIYLYPTRSHRRRVWLPLLLSVEALHHNRKLFAGFRFSVAAKDAFEWEVGNFLIVCTFVFL